jgi:hypothetical protein
MPKAVQLAALAAAAVLTAGCLHREATHTLYISADGALEWMADEAEVYSDDRDPAARRAEEQAFLAAAADTSGRAGRALAALGPDGPVRALVVRDALPFRVVTTARFDSIERVLAQLFHDSGIAATVRLTGDGERMRLDVAFDFNVEESGGDAPAAALLEDFERFRFVLTDGTFVEWNGFERQGERVAVLSKEWLEAAEAEFDRGGRAALSLTWTRLAQQPADVH